LNGIGRIFEDLRLINNLSVLENIELSFKNNLSDKWYNTIFPSSKLKAQKLEFTKRINEILKQFHLVEVQDQLGGEISYGQQKLLSIACCVANDAQLLLLDEPVAGVNPIYREQLTGILKVLKEQGKNILLIEHNTDFINEVADAIFFLANGQITQYKNLEQMKQDENVLNAYM
jgi:ABC-type branched-subunit amino acid transport system ATPase component